MTVEETGFERMVRRLLAASAKGKTKGGLLETRPGARREEDSRVAAMKARARAAIARGPGSPVSGFERRLYE